MSREELKRLWFNIPNKKQENIILVETKYGHVTIIRGDLDGYSSFKTSQGENALQYAIDRMNENNGIRDLSKYQLIIK
jgi:hypothetical protein